MSTSAPRSDDTIPAEYPYSWSPGTALSIQEFVAKYKPSMVQNDGTKPWIWVRPKENVKTSLEKEAAAIVEAGAYLQEVTDKIEQIKNDASIPARGSKKAGTRSKKEVREQVQTEATDELKKISKKYGYVCGKWLIFAPSDKVDVIWTKIAVSLVSGSISSTSAFCAKVATLPDNALPGYQHLICIYIPNVYDKEDVTAVMKVLLRQHGLNLSGVKSNLYTIIGLDSKHPSGIPSTVWKSVSLMKDSEIKELKEAYYAELLASKATTTTAGPSKESKPTGGKLKFLVKRKAEEDPFASEDEADPKSKKLISVSGKRKAQWGEDEEEGNKPPVRKKAL